MTEGLLNCTDIAIFYIKEQHSDCYKIKWDFVFLFSINGIDLNSTMKVLVSGQTKFLKSCRLWSCVIKRYNGTTPLMLLKRNTMMELVLVFSKHQRPAVNVSLLVNTKQCCTKTVMRAVSHLPVSSSKTMAT